MLFNGGKIQCYPMAEKSAEKSAEKFIGHLKNHMLSNGGNILHVIQWRKSPRKSPNGKVHWPL